MFNLKYSNRLSNVANPPRGVGVSAENDFNADMRALIYDNDAKRKIRDCNKVSVNLSVKKAIKEVKERHTKLAWQNTCWYRTYKCTIDCYVITVTKTLKLISRCLGVRL